MSVSASSMRFTRKRSIKSYMMPCASYSAVSTGRTEMVWRRARTALDMATAMGRASTM